MLYQVLKRMIDRGDLDGLAEKVDVFFAVGRLTENEYRGLTEMLGSKGSD